MNYEDGMTVFYDPVSKTVIVAFRGKTTILKGPFESLRAGVAAGEDLCAELGWRSNTSDAEKSDDVT
ncbi:MULTISPECIES: hypothetical protein [unclassified Rhizobium]|jgi:hypothetical protein|uniref:hypothetical protein n=1 Tax=unclassified Rhizobium TaxID=2613769 RepID=UPI0009865B76|nr:MULTISPECIES: hypothetical protein [unclassified Rhizobium]TIX93274.1 hypothetical protein BSK43_001130 [Rhizobium sp. P44RR-XXIV]TIX93398.1 hypothetical protein BSK43_001910 [Rhizobium sp. P44RR-XXIV]